MIRRKGKKQRWAAATVELAVVTPLLLTMLFGIIEYGWVFSVKQALVTAAREGARTAALPGSTEEDVQERVANYLTPMGLSTYNLELTRSTPQDPTETVHVTIPYADVTLIGSFFGSTDYDLGATCSMRKEALGG
ncbi:MAG: pilus assembly protein [Phycisphaerae bacterium]